MMINIASPPRPQALDLGGLEKLPGVCVCEPYEMVCQIRISQGEKSDKKHYMGWGESS